MKNYRNIVRSIVVPILLVMTSASSYGAGMSLLDAAKNGDTAVVRKLINQGADINQQGKFGYAPLMWAIEQGHIETAVLLINSGADVNIRSEGGWTPLIFATNRGQSKIVQLLLDKGANVNVMLDAGWSPLVLAATTKRLDIVKLLLSRHADVDLAIGGLEKLAADRRNLFDAREPISLLVKAKEEHEQTAAKKQEVAASKAVSSDIDVLPMTKAKPNKNAFAIVIGIENYRQRLPRADFATGDAKLVREYLTKALGYPEENVITLMNEQATKSDFEKYIEEWLPKNFDKNGSLFFYYSGHGAPNPKTSDAFLVPYDGDPNFIEKTGYPLKKLYEHLARLPAKEVIVALDSCFSGAGGRSVLAEGSRPLVMNMPTALAPAGNMIIMAASSGSEVSSSYQDKGHGLFTYFLLKGIKGEADANEDGRLDIEELYQYLKPQVQKIARRLYNNEQTPQLIAPEPAMKGIVLQK